MDNERAAGQVALRLHECGHPGEWRLQPSRRTQFCFAGWPIPPCDDVDVVATSDVVSIRVLTGNTSRTITFERDSQDWRPTDSSALPEAPARAARWPVLTIESLSTESVSRLLKADAYNSAYEGADRNIDLLIHTCGAARSVLSDFAPIYVPWVNQVVRCIVPLAERTGTLNSSSGNLAPGVITVSNQSNPYILAEMLVHEGTHQYLYIIKRLGPIDDGTDETLYFSPFRNMGRPILYIVFAYHAFANVLLFYRMLRAAGVTQAASGVDLDLQIKKLEEQLLTIEEALRSTRALTAIGRALWLPLAREIRK
jgi:HEXXH motif-containing protein